MSIGGHDPQRSTAENYLIFGREARGRSPVYESLSAAVAEDDLILEFLATLPRAKRQPNLLFAAARFLLDAPPAIGTLRALVRENSTELSHLMRARCTQTNEPARCATLLPALAALPGPLALIEVGASAGLTLLFDRPGIGLLHEHLTVPALIGCGLLAAGLAFASASNRRSGRSATRAPAAPARAAPPAEAATSHRVTRGSSRHDARLAATSSASDRAPAATQARADPAPAAGPCRAANAPSPRARSRAPSARPNTWAATSSAAAPTHGRAGTVGQARAVTPSATRPAATAVAPRRSSDGISVEVTCTPFQAAIIRGAPDG
jgi:hypothetical protein